MLKETKNSNSYNHLEVVAEKTNKLPLDRIGTEEDTVRVIEDCSLCRQYVESHQAATRQILTASTSYESISNATTKRGFNSSKFRRRRGKLITAKKRTRMIVSLAEQIQII